MFLLFYNNIIKDISVSDMRGYCIIDDGKVIESDSIIDVQPGDYFEGSFPKDEVIKVGVLP